MLGRVLQQWVPYTEDFSTSYRAPIISSLAAPATYEYDVLGRIVKTIDPDGTESTTAYDDGQTTSVVAGVSERVQRTDIYGRLTEVEEVLLPTERHTTRYTYDTLNNLVAVVDAAGNRTALVYDSLGRKIGMDDPDMGTWTYAYDDVDNLLRQTDARLIETHFAYDALNRLKQKTYTRPAGSTVPLPAMVTYTYDGTHVWPAKPNSVGKLSKIVDGSGDSTFQYDVLGRLTKESKTINSTTYTTERAYDLLGRLTSVTYPGPGLDIASYTYTLSGSIKTATLKRYTSGGQLTATHPIVSDVRYNAAGQLTQLTYGNGVVTDYTYNPLTLRLSTLQTTHPITGILQQFAYGFDGLGNVSRLTGAAANVGSGTHPVDQTFDYDRLSRLTRAQGPYGDFHYAYDPLGNMTAKEGLTMRYGQGAGPHAVTSTSGSEALQLTYDANGNMLRKEPVGEPLTRQDLVFDAENRLVEVKTAQETTVSVTFQPGWNFFSLPVIPKTHAVADLFPAFAQQFEQIAREKAGGGFEHYVGQEKFDDFSELDYGVGYQVYCKAAAPVTIAFTGKVPSQRLSKSLTAGWHLLPALVVDSPKSTSWLTTGLSADAVLKINSTTGVTAPATEIAAGQAYWVHLTLAGVFSPSLPRDPTTTFVYDGDGGRVKQTTAAGTTLYLGELQEQTLDGTVTKHLFAGSQRLASLVIPPSSASSLRFFHGDHLGSTNLVTDSTGKVIEVSENTPYGTLYHHEGSATSPHQFAGQRLDPSTGLLFYQARYYDAQLGRFISPDPFVQAPDDPQTLNRYSYVRNNPINLVDPTGYSFWSAIGNFFRRAFGGGDDNGGFRISLIPDGPAITINTERKEVGIVGQQNGAYGYAQSGLFYNWESQQAGYRTGAYGYGGSYSAEGRVYYDFANDQAGASFGASGYGSDFYANTDGQRHLTISGESIRIKAAKAGEAVYNGLSSALDSPVVGSIGGGLLAVSGLTLMIGAVPAAVAGSPIAAGVAAVGFGLHMKGNVDMALNVSKMVVSPHEMIESTDTVQLAADLLTTNKPAAARAGARDAGRLINATLRLFRGPGPFPALSGLLTAAKSGRDTIYGIRGVREALDQ